MVDSAIILEKVEKTYTFLYKFMKEKGFDIFLNNLIFKFLMTLFTENTHPSIYLSVIDCLLVSGEIVSFIFIFYKRRYIKMQRLRRGQ